MASARSLYRLTPTALNPEPCALRSGHRPPGPRLPQVLTTENVAALRESVLTLTKTLQHIESISGDVGGLTADSKVKGNVKQLIEALSRLVAD